MREELGYAVPSVFITARHYKTGGPLERLLNSQNPFPSSQPSQPSQVLHESEVPPMTEDMRQFSPDTLL